MALKSIAQLDRKPYQVTVISTSPANTERVYDLVCDLTADTFAHGITCLRSAHSVDLLAPGITKIRLLERLATTVVAPTPAFLCVGDLGKWPGNDFALLGTPYSLSAHEVSSVPDRCWNLAPAGFRNSQATHDFFGFLELPRLGIRGGERVEQIGIASLALHGGFEHLHRLGASRKRASELVA